MSETRFKWIFVYEDGNVEVVEGTFDDACYERNSNVGTPVAVVRGDFAD